MLPKDYLTPREYALYERFYGPPLRETEPDDVGITASSDVDSRPPDSEDGYTIVRSVEGGQIEAVKQEIADDGNPENEGHRSARGGTVKAMDLTHEDVERMGRNPRERAALLRLLEDFKATQKRENSKLSEAKEEVEGAKEKPVDQWPEEADLDGQYREESRSQFHRHTLRGHFHSSSVEIQLPKERILQPISNLLTRSHPHMVKAAAEEIFGGPGLPSSPGWAGSIRRGKMEGVGFHPDRRHMTEIQADAFIAAYLPPMYASVLAILREVRRRLGSDWLQSRLQMGKEGGLSVLDVGGGGAGLLAWDEVLRAEWEVLKDDGKVQAEHPPQWRKTAVIGSERLRNRVKTFLENTTFLPRLPDYEHSGQTQGEHLDAGDKPQPRKQSDVVIASHLLLQELPGFRRQEVVESVWNMVNKDGGILIIIEKPHPRGFEAMAHARDTVLKQYLVPQSDEPETGAGKVSPALQGEKEQGHVIAPCTTQGTCPMYKQPGESVGRKDSCHFVQRYVQPGFTRSAGAGQGKNQGKVMHCFVAIRRGVPRKSSLTGREATRKAFDGYEDSQETPDMQTTPRLILAPLKRQRHVTMDVCTPEGILERWTVPHSYSKQAYHDARKAQWGDLWSLGAKTRIPRKVRLGRGVIVETDAKSKKKQKMERRKREREAKMARKTQWSRIVKKGEGVPGDDWQTLPAEEEEAMLLREIDEESEAEDEEEDEYGYEDEDEGKKPGRQPKKRGYKGVRGKHKTKGKKSRR